MRRSTSARPSGAAAQRQGHRLVLLGALLVAIAAVGLWLDFSWVAQPFYAWAWWGYILILDGLVARRRGDSLLTTRRRYVPAICVWSITFWFLFELVNARIQNWYYVGVYPVEDFAAGTVFTLLSFATVFMGIFETYDALTASGLWRDRRGRRLDVSRRLTWWLQAVGLATLALALLYPRYLAPLVWGCFTLVVDPWNYRRGARSLLRDLEAGDRGLLGRLLVAGLACGLVWESLNYFAPQKWIYTVRGLEELKLFEMPLLGFLGFPALALDSVAAFSLLGSFFLGNRSWERSEDLSYELELRAPARRSSWIASGVAQVLFWAAVAHFATPINVGSLRLELDQLGLSAATLETLDEMGIERPRQLLRRLRSEPAETGARLAIGDEEAGLLADRLALYTFKGIGHVHGRLLERLGFRRPADLASADPVPLHRRLERTAADAGVAPPRLDFVRVWVLAARGRYGNGRDSSASDARVPRRALRPAAGRAPRRIDGRGAI